MKKKQKPKSKSITAEVVAHAMKMVKVREPLCVRMGLVKRPKCGPKRP